jgi:ribokinase
MHKILVSGLINIETTLKIERFPLEYFPVTYPFGGVHSSVSGVGMNVALALNALGVSVSLLSLIGDDPAAVLVTEALRQGNLEPGGVRGLLAATPQSVILYDGDGRRQIHVDLKDCQETPYPEAAFRSALAGSQLAALCTINFSRPFLKLAAKAGVPIATDVHVLKDPADAYNKDFMKAADILFLSDEGVGEGIADLVGELADRYPARVIVAGCGAQGALLYDRRDGSLTAHPAVKTRKIVNTIGAGDALFSAFLAVYAESGDPVDALRRAQLFASWKIGETGAASGFLAREALERLAREKFL